MIATKKYLIGCEIFELMLSVLFGKKSFNWSRLIWEEFVVQEAEGLITEFMVLNRILKL